MRSVKSNADPRPSDSLLGRNVYVLSAVSFLNDVATEMIYPLLPAFLTSVLGANAEFIGAIEGAAESTAAILKLVSGWWSDRLRVRKPMVVGGYFIASAIRPFVAMAQTAMQVLLIRVGDRIGKGIRNSPRDALIADSVDPSVRGRAFGLNSAADNAGALLGPLIAFALLTWSHATIRAVFWLAVIPGAIGVAVAFFGIREIERPAGTEAKKKAELKTGMGRRFWAFLTVIFLFTLGNSTDAFLLLRAKQLGVSVALAPILWAVLNAVKSVSNIPGGTFADRVGKRAALFAGWVVYAAIYFGFARANNTWQAWALFAGYGIYFGLTEGSSLALVADVVPKERRGAAYGWYYLAIGLGALPASFIFGLLWDRFSSAAAFEVGAALALVSAVLLLFLPPGKPSTD